MHMKDYTLTVRQVLENLASLAESYETVSRGGSPTGNYFFAINVADMAASLKAAQVLISQLPQWIPVEERLPEMQSHVFVSVDGVLGIAIRYCDGWYWPTDEWHTPFTPTHWMPLPEPPEVR